MARVNNMIKMSVVVYIISYVADTSIFSVIQHQLANDVEYAKDTQDDYYESMYGDFESLIEERRERDRLLIGVQA